MPFARSRPILNHSAPFLGAGKYLMDVQAHYNITGELVQGGQLIELHVPPGKFG